jgi:hypothetical protein
MAFREAVTTLRRSDTSRWYSRSPSPGRGDRESDPDVAQPVAKDAVKTREIRHHGNGRHRATSPLKEAQRTETIRNAMPTVVSNATTLIVSPLNA